MFNEINIQTVLLSIIVSMITSHIVTNIKLIRVANLIESLDKHTKEYVSELKKITINAIKDIERKISHNKIIEENIDTQEATDKKIIKKQSLI